MNECKKTKERHNKGVQTKGLVGLVPKPESGAELLIVPLQNGKVGELISRKMMSILTKTAQKKAALEKSILNKKENNKNSSNKQNASVQDIFNLHQSIVALQRKAGNRTVGGLLLNLTTRLEAPDLVSPVQRDAREDRIRAASRTYKIPPGTSGCYLHLLLLIDAGRKVRPLTTAGEVNRYRKLERIAGGATVSDLVELLKTKGIVRRSRWFHYPKTGRSYRTLKKLSLQGDLEGFVMSRVRTGRPAYFAVSFRNIHSGFILVTSTGKVLWLDQMHKGGIDNTGKLNEFLSRYLDRYVEVNSKQAWYKSTKITELRF